MSQESVATDTRLYRLAKQPGNFPGLQEGPGASIEFLPDDWNRGAGDHPYDQAIWTVQALK
jgi:hypothetical protein